MIKKKCVKEWSTTTNFIDQNDNFVGYDVTSQHCCESAYYKFYQKSDDGFTSVEFEDLPEDVCFIGLTDFSIGDDNSNYFNSICFEITGGYYLELVNIHNGYYAHVFEYKINLNQEEGHL